MTKWRKIFWEYLNKHLHRPQVFRNQGMNSLRWFTLPLICRVIDCGLIAGYERFVLSWIFCPTSRDCSPHTQCAVVGKRGNDPRLRCCWARRALFVGLVTSFEAVFCYHSFERLTLQNNLWTILCSTVGWWLGLVGGILVQIKQFLFRWSRNGLFIKL